jgi:diguanylate cyclase (GGDEF)-like protein
MKVVMPDMTNEPEIFIAELDAAIEAHMAWSRRILRCAVLKISPGDDVLSLDAHNLCRFGRWFNLNKDRFDEIDSNVVQQILVVHETMHAAIRSICGGVMNGIPGSERELEVFDNSQSELLTKLANLKTLALANAVRHDPLTGLPLRYNIESDFKLCRNDAKRNKTLLYIVMIDIDHFKLINDNYGHPVGDLALRHLADTLKKSLRSKEPLYRFGGEEFLWILRCESIEEARLSAQRVLTSISSASVNIPDSEDSLKLTVTLGLALVGDLDDLSSIIKRADLALYKGKHAGRNCYVIANP